jgi:hypothetical protein
MHFHYLLPSFRLIVGQTTCFGISQAPGNVRVARGQKEYLSQGPLSDIQLGTTKPARRQVRAHTSECGEQQAWIIANC